MMVKPATAQDERSGARGFNNGPVDGETRKAMNAAFEAMSEWRDEMSSTAERHSTKLYDKLGAVAKAAGWPASVVETTKANMQQMTKMQLQAMDQILDAWTEQMKSPGKLTFANVFAQGLPGMPALSGMPGTSSMPGMAMPEMDLSKFGFGTNPMAPFQFWMEATQLWQKQWADAVSAMVSGMPNATGGRSSQDYNQGSSRTTLR